MASIGHVIAGVAMAVVHRPASTSPTPATTRQKIVAAAWFSCLALAPDLDVVGFRFGTAYADEWGHRGASHSLLFALVLGLVLALPTAWGLRARLWPTAVAVVAALASHGLLDTLTDGGLGAALFWPVDLTRCFAPWRPLPVAPIGRAFLSLRGLRCIAWESLMLGPFLLAALVYVRRRPR
jgi:inner membrane protein